MRYVIGIDVGTSGTKTVLLYQPQNGYAEQDPSYSKSNG